MNENTYHILMPILKDFSFIAGFSLFLFSLVVGLLLVIKPTVIYKLNKKGDRGYSCRRYTKFLEIPNVIDPIFYKHHVIVGTVVTITSAYILYYFLIVYDESLISAYISGLSNALVLDLLINTLRLFMLFCSVFIFFIGLTIVFRPSQIKKVEQWANHWVSTRQKARELSTNHDGINQLAYKYPRVVGSIISILSLYASILLFLIYTQ